MNREPLMPLISVDNHNRFSSVRFCGIDFSEAVNSATLEVSAPKNRNDHIMLDIDIDGFLKVLRNLSDGDKKSVKETLESYLNAE